MEFKNPTGVPPATGTTPFNGMHPKAVPDFANTPMPTSPLRPDATRATPSSSQPSSSTPATTSDQNFMHTIVATPLAAISPPPHMPEMSMAIVPHSGMQSSLPNASLGGTDSMKKKRGRPRKYGADGTVTITIKQFPSPGMNPLSPLQKRGRGRPPGSGKNQQLAALGDLLCASAGAGFTPHAITVAAGEDVATKIMSFSQQGPRGICILSANGAISNVTLRQSAVSGGTVTYEGRFEILSLSGSFLVTEYCRTGGLSVSLAGPDGRVIGGSVAGMLMAASPVQVVVGSFVCLSSKKSYTKHSKVHDASKLATSTGAATTNMANNVATANVANNVAANMANNVANNVATANVANSVANNVATANVADNVANHVATANVANNVAAPDPPLNDREDSNKQDSSPHNQSSGNAASSNDASSQGQMIAVQMGWPPTGSQQEVRRSTDINMRSPEQ